ASAALIRRDDLRVGHAAHALSRELVIGEPCPVCRHPVEAIHEPGEIPELDRAVSEVEAAITRVDAEQREVDSARAALTEVETTRSNLISRREQLAEGVAAGPDLDALADMEETLEELKKRQTATREELEKTETKVKEARKTVEDLAGREHSMGRLLQTALIAVADLDPPVSESDDVVVQWKDLLIWRDGAMTRIADEQETAVAKAAETRSRHQGLRQGLIDELAGAGLTPAEPFVATIASEIERARSTLALQERVLEESAVLTVEIDTETSNAAVAAGLATHLRADGFERWMMAGALHTLVVGANDLLAQLSDGGYSLHSEDGTFTVVDHRNADERRSVSTLSGGETFLVSLALALSLAETLASGGGARLDAIILDEGFGTLDDESLDTVATVLEELAGHGLMVGVITHVKELASRAPTRFEVTRGARGSTVKEMA
ncbi:MAG: SMC family ATPase, partial [Actinobacteria bacterium]|nr:SMC family ATPase [Actinomycetota bacterium]